MVDETPPLSDQDWAGIMWRFNQDDPRAYDQLRADGRALLAEMTRLNHVIIETEAEVDRLRAREAAAMAIVRDVAKGNCIVRDGDSAVCVFCDDLELSDESAPDGLAIDENGWILLWKHKPGCPVTRARSRDLLDQE